jgi:hypothetical protein
MDAVTLQSDNSRFIFRYAVGATLMVAFAMGFNWKLGFIVPVLGLSFLASGENAPSLKKGLAFVIIISIASLIGLFLSYAFLGIPIIHVLVTFLLLLHVFYSTAVAPSEKVWLIITVLVIPNVALLSPDIAGLISMLLMFYALMAVVLVWLTFLIIPFKRRFKDPRKADIVSIPDKNQRFVYAITTTLVIMPVYLMFYYFELTGSLLILIFIALLSMQPAFAKDFKGGVALILGNLIGGIASIIVYEILTVVPVFGYFLILVFLTGLLLGRQLFGTKKAAPLFGMAFSTFLLIICSVTGMSSNDASSKLWSRVIQIMIAVIYVVTAFGLINRFRRINA